MSIKYFRHIVQTFKRLTRGPFHKIIPLWRGIAWDESELSLYLAVRASTGLAQE